MGEMLKRLRKWVRMLLDVPVLLTGLAIFTVRGTTPEFAYRSLLSLFLASGGRSNDWITRAFALVLPQYQLSSRSGVLGDPGQAELRHLCTDLEERGYHVFEKKLPPPMLESLLRYARTGECRITVNCDGTRNLNQQKVHYRGDRPEGLLYVFDTQDVINHPIVGQLFADSSLLSLAQAYLKNPPVLDMPSLWWSTAAATQASSDGAQMYHFDLDRVKWLKFFFYLTDVGPGNGPHMFVSGSHLSSGIAPQLLARGYVRHSDREIAEAYDPKQVVELTGGRGTIIAVDTRGLHKGKHVETGERLMLQLQFSASLFGTTYPPAHFAATQASTLAGMIEKYPRLYSLFR